MQNPRRYKDRHPASNVFVTTNVSAWRLKPMAIKHTLTRTVVLGFKAWREFILPDLPRTNSRGKRVQWLLFLFVPADDLRSDKRSHESGQWRFRAQRGLGLGLGVALLVLSHRLDRSHEVFSRRPQFHGFGFVIGVDRLAVFDGALEVGAGESHGRGNELG